MFTIYRILMVSFQTECTIFLYVSSLGRHWMILEDMFTVELKVFFLSSHAASDDDGLAFYTVQLSLLLETNLLTFNLFRSLAQKSK